MKKDKIHFQFKSLEEIKLNNDEVDELEGESLISWLTRSLKMIIQERLNMCNIVINIQNTNNDNVNVPEKVKTIELWQ